LELENEKPHQKNFHPAKLLDMEIKKKDKVLKLWWMTQQVPNLNKRFKGFALKAAQHQPVGAICVLPIVLVLSSKFWTLEKTMMKFGKMMWLTISNQVT